MARLFLLICVVTTLTKSYFIGPDRLKWDEAEQWCISQDSHLASVHSSEDLATISTLCYEHHSNDMDCHIGMYWGYNDNKWHWIDGTNTADSFGFKTDGSPNEQTPPWQHDTAFDPFDDPSENETCHKVDINRDGPNQGFGFLDDTRCDKENPPICNGDAPCNEDRIGNICIKNRDCPSCMRCCKGTKTCEYRPGFMPGYKAAAGEQVMDSININSINDKKNYYGYIVLIGFIAFVLINNIFIGCWCLRKKKKDRKS
eukprot:329942_1